MHRKGLVCTGSNFGGGTEKEMKTRATLTCWELQAPGKTLFTVAKNLASALKDQRRVEGSTLNKINQQTITARETIPNDVH